MPRRDIVEDDRAVGRYAIGELARLSGITVRTLHHYDRIGLLTASERSPAGHRRYTGADLQRLRQVLFYRELGFGLQDILAVLADADSGAAEEHLRRQHRLLRHRQRRTEALLAAVEQEIHVRRLGIALTPEQQFSIFGTDRFTDLFTAATEQWGSDDQRNESARRSATYTVEDWREIQAEAQATIDAFAEAARSGEAASGERAMQAAEAHRMHLECWFHECPPARHRIVATAYLHSVDDRSGAFWEEIVPGFSRYVVDAIFANAERLENPSR